MLTLLLLGTLGVPPATGSERVRIGVLAFQGAEQAMARWSPTADYLSRSVADHAFTVVPLNLHQMREAMASGQIDFALTNPGNYVELEAQFGISRIATLRKRSGDQISTQFGAVLFTRADRSDIQGVSDLRGHSFMAVGENAFGGFQMAWGLLRHHGVDPFNDLSELRFAGFPQDEIVFAVRDRRVDVGTVRSDVLERLAQEKHIRLEEFRVLEARDSDGFAPLHSTVLYPEWPFAKLRHTSRRLSQDVAVALLTLPEDDPVALAAGSAGWTIPLDYSAVHELFRTLKIGPYALAEEVSVVGALRRLAPWLATGAVIVLLLATATIYVTGTNRRLAESDQALRIEIVERRQAQEALARHRDTLEERVNERTEALARLNDELQLDIAARKKAEEALRRSDVALRDVSETTSNPHLDHRQKIDRVLQAGIRYFDMQTGVLTDRSDTSAQIRQSRGKSLRPPAAAAVTALADSVAAAGQPVLVRDSAQAGTDGGITFRRYVAAPVVFEDQPYGSVVLVAGSPTEDEYTAVDLDILQLMAQWIGREIERVRVDERAAMHEAELNHVSRMNVMGELATGLAHEINQPLTAIANYTRGCVRRLRRDDFKREELLHAMELAVDEAERASAIVRQLREFLGTGEVGVEPICLNDSVAAVLRLAGPEAQRRNITITTNLATELPLVAANSIQIEQVILNLLNNAIEAVVGCDSANRSIRLNTGVEGNVVALSVSDSGPGLQQTDSEQLFDPFFTTKPSGMGLGLSISRSILGACGGEIVAHNDPGGGATFRVILPPHALL